MKNIIRKIKKILFVRRVETKNKWWHRLALVLIYGSVTIAGLFLVGLVVDDFPSWEKYKSYSYSYNFEQGYEFLDVEEISCGGVGSGRLGLLGLRLISGKCGDYETIVKKYNDSIRSVLLTDETKEKCTNYSNEKINDRSYIPVKERASYSQCEALQSSAEIIKPDSFVDLTAFLGGSKSILSLEQRSFLQDSYNELESLKAKRNLDDTFYGKAIADILISILIIILGVISLIIFLESIIYRTILYIIYGKQK